MYLTLPIQLLDRHHPIRRADEASETNCPSRQQKPYFISIEDGARSIVNSDIARTLRPIVRIVKWSVSAGGIGRLKVG